MEKKCDSVSRVGKGEILEWNEFLKKWKMCIKVHQTNEEWLY